MTAPSLVTDRPTAREEVEPTVPRTENSDSDSVEEELKYRR